MTRNVPAKLVILLDRSGSMAGIKSVTVDMLNDFIKEQKAIPGECELQIIQFDHSGGDCCLEYLREPTPLAKIRPISEVREFWPRGGTPIWDAMAGTIKKVKKELDGGPGRIKVILVMVTDGGENDSVHFRPDQVAKLVAQYGPEGEGWEFVYLGANQDAIEVGKMMGIPKAKSMTYCTTDASGISSLASALGTFVRNVRVNTARGIEAKGFTEADRKAAMGKLGR